MVIHRTAWYGSSHCQTSHRYMAQCSLDLLETMHNAFAKAPTIKVEIDKLHRSKFIYPIEYTSWVSNPTPITKKQGTISVCIYFD